MFLNKRLLPLGVLTSYLLSLFVLGYANPAWAGCGCDKLPPELAEVRPNVTYAGSEVTLFHPSLQTGQAYQVIFQSGTTGKKVGVEAIAVTRRDLADGAAKPQVVVSVPNLPLGPARIVLKQVGQKNVLLKLTDSAFTVAPQPVSLPENIGELIFSGYQAAVSRDGLVYFSFDISDIHHPRIFNGDARGYPLRFSSEDVVFTNPQGFLMQLLEEDIQGLFALPMPASNKNSTGLQYARHEFNSFAFLHTGEYVHKIDAQDPQWHTDNTPNTPHIDHDHIIMAVSGLLADGSVPTPGATPAFDLVVNISTFFQHGLFGSSYVSLSDQAATDSYNSQTGQTGVEGDVSSNGQILLSGEAAIAGDVMAGFSAGLSTTLSGTAKISGETAKTAILIEPLQVDIPMVLPDLGSLIVSGSDTLRLEAGSYQVSEFIVSGKGQVFVDNTSGPVTLYVTGPVQMSDQAMIHVAHTNPEEFAVYVADQSAVQLAGAATFSGVLYAPESSIQMTDQAELFGAFVGASAVLTDGAQAHYDSALQAE